MFPWRKNLKDKTDEELMLLIGDGNEQAFTFLYDRYAAKMLRFIYRMTGEEDKSQDIMHDLFMKLIEKPERFDGAQSFSPWFYRMASNACLNEIRNSRNRLRILKDSFSEESVITKDANSIDSLLFKAEYERQLEKLDDDQKLILHLRFAEELQIREIAAIMELPEGTVKSRIFYLLKKFSKSLKAFNPKNEK